MPTDTLDRVAALFDRFRIRAHQFHEGPLCGVTHYGDDPALGFLHVLREGTLTLTHPAAGGLPARLTLTEPSLVFYPRACAHGFHNPARGGPDLVCAALRFDGGAEHPLARALPPLVVLPLAELPALQPTLALLFAEARLPQVADRLFEVLLIQLLRWVLDHPERCPVRTGMLAGLAHPQIAHALVAMQAEPAHPWTVASLAQRAGMSRSAFAQAFHRVMEETPAEHLAQWRLALAQQRLARGHPVKQVAHDVGYGSASALSRAFSARRGQSPRAWCQAHGAARRG
jgi:AraC-like DNA-binding protein